jgi:hypothetical protein
VDNTTSYTQSIAEDSLITITGHTPWCHMPSTAANVVFGHIARYVVALFC